MKENVKKRLVNSTAQAYLKDVQYQNAVFAVRQIETDRGGLTLREIWEETEKLREQLRGVEKELRDRYLIDNLPVPEKVYHSSDPMRTQMCVLALFALRLICANSDLEKNPHQHIIEAILRWLFDKDDKQLQEDYFQLLDMINRDGDVNEARGNVVESGVDILAPDPEWCDQLRAIVERYKEKVYKAGIIAYGAENEAAFEAIWEALLQDDWFVAEMHRESLHMDFNLKLLFNVYGMIYRHMPSVYTSEIRGGKGLADVFGENPNSKGHTYSKDYFNDMTYFDRFRTILTNYKTKLNDGI